MLSIQTNIFLKANHNQCLVCENTSNNENSQFTPQNTRYNHCANTTNVARPSVVIEEAFNTKFMEQPRFKGKISIESI